jgi:hypothetical protein
MARRMDAKLARIFMDLPKSMADRSCRILPIGAPGTALRVHASSQIARTRADFERFSEMSENLETGWWSRRDLNSRPNDRS